MNPTTRSLLFWMVLVVVVVAIWNLSSQFRAGESPVAFSEFIRWVETGQVDRVELTGNEIAGTSSSGETFRTYAPPQYEGLANKLIERDVVIQAREAVASPWATLLYSWAPILLIIGFWVFFMRQVQSGGNKALSFGKSRAKLSSNTQKKVTFKDVAGVDEPKDELQEIIEFLREPQKFQKLGGRIPKGVLLMGPPGTGKTLIAKAIANEAKANFITIKGPELISKWVGESEKAIREVFKKAKQASPSIIFLDEFESIAGARTPNSGEGSDVSNRVVNQMLSSMDGVESMEGVIVIAATNRPEMIDPALLRSGRFERVMHVPPPDHGGLRKILNIHSKDMPLGKFDLESLTDKMQNFTGADVEAVCREAALIAMRAEKKSVSKKHFEEAISRVRPTITPEMMEYYSKLEGVLTSGLESIRRKSDTLMGIESV